MNTTQPQDTDTYQTDTPEIGSGPAGSSSTGPDPTGPNPAGSGQADPRPEVPFGYSPDRSALRRPFQGRMLAGVAEGVARYFGVDTTLVRIGFVVLTVIGGAGVPLYLAGLLLIPDEGSDQSIAASIIESLQNRSR
jgi:phage shock protein PspC (stress-responsive transcriptional regulator)